jgi:hypothetical protein
MLFELGDRLLVDSRCPSVCLHSLVCLPDFLLGYTKRFCFVHASPPFAGCLPSQSGRRRSFGLVPLQNLQPYYERLRPCAPPRYSHPCGGCPLGFLPSHRDDRFLRSSSKPESRSRRLHARRQLGSQQASPNPYSRNRSLVPVSTSPEYVSTLHQRFTSVRLLDSYLTDSSSAFSSNAHDQGS